MAKKKESKVPTYDKLIEPTYKALRSLGGSGKNDEIVEKIIDILKLPDDVVDESHNGSTSLTELEYKAYWARTYLKKYGAIENIGRSLWSIHPNFIQVESVNSRDVVNHVK